jgi:hypothetical protein
MEIGIGAQLGSAHERSRTRGPSNRDHNQSAGKGIILWDFDSGPTIRSERQPPVRLDKLTGSIMVAKHDKEEARHARAGMRQRSQQSAFASVQHGCTGPGRGPHAQAEGRDGE